MIANLIQAVRGRSDQPADIREETARFVSRILETTDLAVALIPHVDPLDGSVRNSDSAYMSAILRRVGSGRQRLALLPRTFNAAQLKYVISRCRFFIGARTHATIAARSSSVPTISIGYSVKARGLNMDLFNSLDYVLDTTRVDGESLWRGLVLLREPEQDIRDLLACRIPKWCAGAAISAERLKVLLE